LGRLVTGHVLDIAERGDAQPSEGQVVRPCLERRDAAAERAVVEIVRRRSQQRGRAEGDGEQRNQRLVQDGSRLCHRSIATPEHCGNIAVTACLQKTSSSSGAGSQASRPPFTWLAAAAGLPFSNAARTSAAAPSHTSAAATASTS